MGRRSGLGWQVAMLKVALDLDAVKAVGLLDVVADLDRVGNGFWERSSLKRDGRCSLRSDHERGNGFMRAEALEVFSCDATADFSSHMGTVGKATSHDDLGPGVHCDSRAQFG